jgi:thymidine phosphorylase
VTVALGGELLMLGGLAATAGAGRTQISQAFRSGTAAEVFARMVAALGGPTDFLERYGEHLSAAPIVHDVAPSAPGVVREIDTRAVGVAVIELGGGRRRAADPIDHAVGFTDLAGIGAAVHASRPLARVHARTDGAADAGAEALRAAYTIGAEAFTDSAVILGRVA